MHFLKKYYDEVVRRDLINKFPYTNINKLPKIVSVKLSFNFKKYDVNSCVSSLTALKGFGGSYGGRLKPNSSQISVVVRQGEPISCSVTLRKKKLSRFLELVLNNLMFKDLKVSVTEQKKGCVMFFKITNILLFQEFEENYQFFKDVAPLNVWVYTTGVSKEELKFLSHSYKIDS